MLFIMVLNMLSFFSKLRISNEGTIDIKQFIMPQANQNQLICSLLKMLIFSCSLGVK